MPKGSTKAQLTKKGIELFGNEIEFKKWLSEPNLSLGNKKPSDLMKSVSGREQIRDAIEALNYGAMM